MEIRIKEVKDTKRYTKPSKRLGVEVNVKVETWFTTTTEIQIRRKDGDKIVCWHPDCKSDEAVVHSESGQRYDIPNTGYSLDDLAKDLYTPRVVKCPKGHVLIIEGDRR